MTGYKKIEEIAIFDTKLVIKPLSLRLFFVPDRNHLHLYQTKKPYKLTCNFTKSGTIKH